ncbi:MAG TPA: AsmA family protein [Noviherbaspirillum sp.]|uniref:AsmA family protein n=1 Tax=Noviherbaspirillum sp. TaxID=1926288 RepID=UPI002B473CD2|nr:AsmA family protein [Noviherbaspirillum sp.]HJV87410.1 AsmA family protein [Noviherbaspirillum sp.]
MPKTARIVLIALAALVALLLAAAGIVAATFNPNDYKPLLIRMVQEKKQRTLRIPGDIKLSFFPKLGAKFGPASISERNSSAEFASVDSARVSLELIPLLAKKLVIDQVQVDGLRATITRHKDGSSNVDDLTAKGEPGQQVLFDIDSVRISHADLVYDDREQDRRFELFDMDMETGRIANGVPSKLKLAADIKGNKPAVNARLSFKSGFTLDLERKRYALKGMDAELKGSLSGFTDLLLHAVGNADLQPDAKHFLLDGIRLSARGKGAGNALEASADIPKLVVSDAKVSGSKLSGEAKLSEGARTISAIFSTPNFEGSPQAFTLPALMLDATIKDAALDAKVKLSGALSGNLDKLLLTSPQVALNLSGRQGDTALNGSMTTPLSINLATQLIDLPHIAADFVLPNPGGGTLALKAGGNASVRLDKKTMSATLKGSLDQSNFNASLAQNGFSPAAYTFDIGIDQLDLDRYQRKSAPPANAPASKPAKPEAPMDFSALQKLQASGSVRVGALKVQNIRTTNVRFDVRAAGGTLNVRQLTASLYGGSVNGGLAITAGRPVRFALRQTLSGINVGPLLKDAIDKAPIEGRGNVQLDVTTSGATFGQIRKALNGTARLELRDGAIRGVNIAQAVRRAKAQIGAIRGDVPAQTGTSSAEEKTDFSELTGSFRIANGIAHNDDLNIKSPLMRIGGSGDINLGDERIDYLVKATVVSTLQGQGGPELQALKGLTVPVRLTGPLASMSWRIDFAGMASELAKQKLEEKKGEVKAKIEEQLKDKLKGFLGR